MSPRRRQEAQKEPQEAPGRSRMLQDAPGASRRRQELPGGPRTLQEAPGRARRPQEAPGGPRGARRVEEAGGLEGLYVAIPALGGCAAPRGVAE